MIKRFLEWLKRLFQGGASPQGGGGPGEENPPKPRGGGGPGEEH